MITVSYVGSNNKLCAKDIGDIFDPQDVKYFNTGALPVPVQLQSVKQLEAFTSLQILKCPYNKIESLEGLENLTSLEFLDCSCNCITSLEPIRNLTSLKKFSCAYNQLTSLEPIVGLTSIQELQCSLNQLPMDNFKDMTIGEIQEYYKPNPSIFELPYMTLKI